MEWLEFNSSHRVRVGKLSGGRYGWELDEEDKSDEKGNVGL